VLAFWLRPAPSRRVWSHRPPPRTTSYYSSTALFSGVGTATNYTWKEEAYELEVTVRVPPETRAKDIVFHATSRSIDLRLLTQRRRRKSQQQPAQADDDDDDDDAVEEIQEIVLLDKERPLRGRVNLDGTYWVLSDPSADNNHNKHREVTVTIEKRIRTPKDDFEVVEYDWKGVYASEDDGEVSHRHYDKPEPLDVREYAAKLGVDIDRIDMSKVDKTMFSNNLNMTQQTLDGLSEAGYLMGDEQDVITRQADGSEYVTDEEGNPVPVTPLGERKRGGGPKQAAAGAVPFLDTDSPWHKAATTAGGNNFNETIAQQTRNFTRAAFAEDSAKGTTSKKTKKGADDTAAVATDPIDQLTVKRLREILKSQGLKVGGSKKELQERLRRQVNSLLQGKQQSDSP